MKDSDKAKFIRLWQKYFNGVLTPFGSDCSSIIYYSYLQRESDHPRAVIGMFDISARPFVSKYTISFIAPMQKFNDMVSNMNESFLITNSW